jgi:hypothetical protein
MISVPTFDPAAYISAMDDVMHVTIALTMAL